MELLLWEIYWNSTGTGTLSGNGYHGFVNSRFLPTIDVVGFDVVGFDVMGLDIVEVDIVGFDVVEEVDVVGFSVVLALGVVDLDFADFEAKGFDAVVGVGFVVLLFCCFVVLSSMLWSSVDAVSACPPGWGWSFP